MDLLAVCDYLITDYSAIALEGAVLNCPTYYFVYDYEEYREKNGMNIDLFEVMPGCVFRNADELMQRLAQGSYPQETLDAYRTLIRDNRKVKAVGEIGLDYHYEDVPREIQKAAFRAQLDLAAELDMPVIVHEREAHQDALEILDDYPGLRGVFHCFSGSKEMADVYKRQVFYRRNRSGWRPR